MSFYETMYIVHPDTSDERLAAIIERYKGIVTASGGTVIQAAEWDRRRLAYPIRKQRGGIYVLMYFNGDAKAVAELERVFHLSDEILRSMTIKHEKPQLVTMPSERMAEPVPAEAPAPASTPPTVAALENALAEAESAEAPQVNEAPAAVESQDSAPVAES